MVVLRCSIKLYHGGVEVFDQPIPWWCGGVRSTYAMVVLRYSINLYHGGVEVFDQPMPWWC